jgi:hypothetical protein
MTEKQTEAEGASGKTEATSGHTDYKFHRESARKS